MLNASQMIGGSLGTALLNTVFAGAVTAYLTANLHNPAKLPQMLPTAFIHGYHVAFVWGAVIFAVALVVTVVLINAKPQDVPAGEATASAESPGGGPVTPTPDLEKG